MAVAAYNSRIGWDYFYTGGPFEWKHTRMVKLDLQKVKIKGEKLDVR